MKLTVHSIKHVSDGSEIRIAEPPFDTSYSVSFSSEEGGLIVIDLGSDQIDEIKDIEVDDWFDGIQWSVSLDKLVNEFRDWYKSGDVLQLDDESRREVNALANALENAAKAVRSMLNEPHAND